MKAWLRRLAFLLGLALIDTPRAAQAPCPPPLALPSGEALAEAQQQARDRGFLWRLSRDGRDSYLFGTLHVGRLAWSAPGPRLMQALRDTDLVALELDPLDPQTSRGFALAMERVAMPQRALGDAVRQRIQRLAERACLPAQVLQGQHPLMQVMQLTVLEARHERLEPFFAQEVMLSLAATRMKRQVLSLETPAQQVAALLPPDASHLGEDLDRALRQIEEGRARTVLRRLAQVWEDGDLQALRDYAAWCDCQHDEHDRATFARLNDQRNAHLATRIAELHARNLKVFAAVGALHMTGPLALTLLLEQQGFRVERVVLSR